MNTDAQHSTAGQLAWLLNLLSITYVIKDATTVDRMQEIAKRIGGDPLITEDNKALLRLIYNARMQQIKKGTV